MSQDGAFLFDQRRFWGDAKVKKMTGDQVALYLKLLSIQWEEGDLPTDADELACEATEGRRIYTAEGLTGGLDKPGLSPALGSLMDGLRGCFEVVQGSPGRMRNQVMHELREAWRARQKKWREAGRKGGSISRKPKTAKELGDKPLPKPPPKPPSKPGLSLAEAGKVRKDKERKGPPEAEETCARVPKITDLDRAAECLAILAGPTSEPDRLWSRADADRATGWWLKYQRHDPPLTLGQLKADLLHILESGWAKSTAYVTKIIEGAIADGTAGRMAESSLGARQRPPSSAERRKARPPSTADRKPPPEFAAEPLV